MWVIGWRGQCCVGGKGHCASEEQERLEDTKVGSTEGEDGLEVEEPPGVDWVETGYEAGV